MSSKAILSWGRCCFDEKNLRHYPESELKQAETTSHSPSPRNVHGSHRLRSHMIIWKIQGPVQVTIKGFKISILQLLPSNFPQFFQVFPPTKDIHHLYSVLTTATFA